jgi:hypothetical protein
MDRKLLMIRLFAVEISFTLLFVVFVAEETSREIEHILKINDLC